MTSIVEQLSLWVQKNADLLQEKGVEVVKKIPEKGSNAPWKGSIGLSYDGIVVSYTVWERFEFQTELIVLNSFSMKTIVMDDNSPKDALVVHADLDSVITKLLNKTYKTMPPDKKLIVS